MSTSSLIKKLSRDSLPVSDSAEYTSNGVLCQRCTGDFSFTRFYYPRLHTRTIVIRSAVAVESVALAQWVARAVSLTRFNTFSQPCCFQLLQCDQYSFWVSYLGLFQFRRPCSETQPSRISTDTCNDVDCISEEFLNSLWRHVRIFLSVHYGACDENLRHVSVEL
jgi:hypothetical protein